MEFDVLFQAEPLYFLVEEIPIGLAFVFSNLWMRGTQNKIDDVGKTFDRDGKRPGGVFDSLVSA